MKPRPRSVEREVAECLSAFYVSMGWKPVERIPVLGRTGPDIQLNESNLVIDVKSRLANPKSHRIDNGDLCRFDDGLIGVRLEHIDLLWTDEEPCPFHNASKVVMGYWQHMNAWREAHFPDGVTCVILHWPKTPIKNSTVVIHQKQRSLLYGTKNT